MEKVFYKNEKTGVIDLIIDNKDPNTLYLATWQRVRKKWNDPRNEKDYDGSSIYKSADAGKTWSKPIKLEVGRVLPDLVLMSNGVLACSYGRPASCIMFSLDGGKTWPSHHVISDKVSFNYTSIREISPGRLLFIHDAPKMNGMTIDVELNK